MSITMYQRYSQNILRHWPYYIAGTMSLLVTTCSEVLIPKFIQWALDLLTTPEKIPQFFVKGSVSESLNFLCLCLLLALLIGWMGRIGWRQLLARRTHYAGHQLKTDFWNSLKHQPLSFLHKYSLGDLMNRATGDWNKSRFIHGFTMVLTFDVVFFTCLSLISMLLIDVPLTLAALLMAPFLPRKIIQLSKKEYDQHQKAQERLSSLSDYISQAVQTVRLQRSTATESIWEKTLGKKAKVYADEQFEVLKIGWKIFILGALPTLFAYGVLFSFGVYRYQQGHITIGEFLALQSYVLLLQSPLFELGSVISEWQTGFASFSRLHEILRLKKAPKKTTASSPTDQVQLAYELRNLSFSYEAQNTVLSNINLRIQKGEKIGITGPIGSGKSTLASILSGLQDGFDGQLSILDQRYEDTGPDWLSSHITIVPQKPFLFAGTIRHNLSLGKDREDSDLINSLKTVRLWDDVEQMSDGLDTWIGEWGINLSGGQKQRLAIARSLLQESSILILDDSLSAVDSVTEEHILSEINLQYQEQTIIWTAHRTSTLQLCNRVFTINDGELEELEDIK